MAEIYAFPVKKELDQQIVECIHEIANAYIQTLNYAFTTMSDDDPTSEELTEIRKLVEAAYVDGLYKAINKMEEEL